MNKATIGLCILILAGCGGGGDTTDPINPPPATVTAISLSSSSIALTGVGSEASLSATLTPAGISAAVSWSTDNPSVATVSGSGTSAVVRATGGGTTRVVAKAGTVQAQANITVTPVARSISIGTDPLTLQVGTKQLLSAVISADAGADRTVTWSSSSAAVATVSSSGEVTALGTGNTVITATLASFPSISATRNVTVEPPQVTVTVEPTSFSLSTASSRQLTAVVNAPAGVSSGVTWSTSASSVATVSATGLVTAVAPGSAVIKATSDANPAAAANATVTVTTPTVHSITLSPSSATIYIGSTRTLVATVDADAGADNSVTWSSSAPAVATVSATGEVTAVAAGVAMITAKSVLVPAVTATAAITAAVPPAATSFSSRRIGSGTSASGYDISSVLSLSATDAIAVGSVILGAGSTYRNHILSLTAAGAQDITPECCRDWEDRQPIVSGAALNKAAVSFYGLFGGAPSRVFRITGTVQQGPTWPPSGVGTNTRIVDIHTTDGSVVLARGDNGKIYRSNGSGWSEAGILTSTPSGWDGRGVFLAADDYMYLTCQPSARLHRWRGDGSVTDTTPVPPAACDDLPYITSLSGVRADSLVAANSAGMHIWNGTSWRTVSSGLASGERLSAVTMCGIERYAASNQGVVYRLNGSALSKMGITDQTAAVSTYGSIETQISCAPDGTLRAASGAGLITRWNGSMWSEENYAPTLKAVSIAPNGSAAAVGNGVVFTRSAGGTWLLNRRFAERGVQLNTVMLRSNGDIWTAGPSNASFGRALVVSRSGFLGWSDLLLPAYSSALGFAPAGTSDAFVLAYSGSLSQYELVRISGSSATPVSFGGAEPAALASHNSGAALIVTRAGSAFRYDGSSWSAFGSTGGSAFNWNVALLSATDAMAATCTGTGSPASKVYHTTGPSTWTEIPINGFPVATCISSVFGNSPGDAYAVVAFLGGTSQLLHWNGSSWTAISGIDASTITKGASIPGLTILTGPRALVMEGVPPAAARLR